MSTSDASRMGPPETPGRRVAASPHFFPSLQFSPDLFQTPISGSVPAAALVLPQNRLFWDPSSNAGEDGPSYQDPFASNQLHLTGPFTPAHIPRHDFQPASSVSSTTGYELPSSQTTQVLAPPMSPRMDDGALPAGFTASPRVPGPATEDPSLFLSSPARRFGPFTHSLGTSSASSRLERHAYHHQHLESRHEDKLDKPGKTLGKKPLETNSIGNGLKRAISPEMLEPLGLKRSSTNSGMGNQSQVSFSDSVSVWHGRDRRPRSRRSSPQQRGYLSPYRTANRSQSRGRTSLSFTIDRDGRAKTVVTQASDPKNYEDALIDSDTDSLDTTDFEMGRSQNPSFSFPEHEEPNRRLNRVTQNSNTHSKSSSYSSTVPSSASARPSSRTSSTVGTLRPRPRLSAGAHSTFVSDIQARRSFTALSSHLEPSHPMAEADADEEDSGEAHKALRAILKDRPARSVSNNNLLGLSQHNFHPSLPRAHQQQPSSTIRYTTLNNTSPTTIIDPDLDLTTPSSATTTDRDRGSSTTTTTTNTSDGRPSVRCVCTNNRSSADPNLMIQCDSCTNVLHKSCISPTTTTRNTRPRIYICVFCVQSPSSSLTSLSTSNSAQTSSQRLPRQRRKSRTQTTASSTKQLSSTKQEQELALELELELNSDSESGSIVRSQLGGGGGGSRDGQGRSGRRKKQQYRQLQLHQKPNRHPTATTASMTQLSPLSPPPQTQPLHPSLAPPPIITDTATSATTAAMSPRISLSTSYKPIKTVKAAGFVSITHSLPSGRRGGRGK